MRKLLVVFFVALLPCVAFAKYVAILETLADSAAKTMVSQSDRKYLTDVLRGEAVKVLPAEQNFTIMTRENINVMLPPGKSIEDCEGSCLAETGKNIAADYVAQARVGMFGGSLTLNVEIYETMSGKLVASFNGFGETVKDLLAVINREASDFFKRVKGGSSYNGVGGVGEMWNGGHFSFQGTQKFIVEIVTNPAGALPTVDGRGFPKCTSTPCKVQVEAGEHRFVASKERYEDAEVVTSVSANNQRVVLNLTPNFGYLDLNPELTEGVGLKSDLRLTVDGKNMMKGKLMLDPGIHAVSVRHPCYDPVEFKVSIEKNKTETFNANLNRGVGGLSLEAEWNGSPQAVPVYIDGREVGSTPFEGEVPMCAEVAVGEGELREAVHVNLMWHEVVKAVHRLGHNPGVVAMAENAPKTQNAVATENDKIRARAAVAYAEMDGKDAPRAGKSVSTSVGESVPANIDELADFEPEKRNIHWIPVIASATVLVSGAVLAIVGNSNAKAASEKKIASEADYRRYKDDARNGQTLRTVGIVTAIVGTLGLGVSFSF